MEETNKLLDVLKERIGNPDLIEPIMICTILTGRSADVLEFIERNNIHDYESKKQYVFFPKKSDTLSDIVVQKPIQHSETRFSPLYLRGLSFSGDIPLSEYYSRLPAVISIYQENGLSFTKPVTFFVGENGVGKSTLIEAIAVAAGFNPEGGTLNFQFTTKETHSSLHNFVKLTRGVRRNTDGFFLRAESFYNAASYLEDMAKWAPGQDLFAPYGGKSLHKQSHGESFMALVENRFSGNGLFILDEPEAALSPMKQLRLLALIHDLASEGAQFIISTHSPILMTLPDADLIQFTEYGLEHLSYEETEHFKVASDFLRYPERMLKEILA